MRRIKTELTNIPRLTKEERAAAANLSDFEVRCLVSNYYESQAARKRSDQQIASMGDRPAHDLTHFMANRFAGIEGDIQRLLDKATDARPIGVWLKANAGIGAVIAAGLIAHVDISRTVTAGAIWRFAGLDPSVTWGKGERRPWNADLKTLCWHIGQSFMKLSNNPSCYYGKLYRERKEYEIARNDSGGNADAAKEILARKTFDKKTEAYKHLSNGKLPPAQIDARARRYAVKIFLSHLHLVWRWLEFGKLPVKPFAIEHLGHAHELLPQHLDLVPGLAEVLRGEGRIAA